MEAREQTWTCALSLAFACPEYVWVVDSVFRCNDAIITPKAVAGRIMTEQGELMPNVAIGLSSGGVNYFKGTNERGAFFFEDFEEAQYELAPGDPFDNSVRNGITTFDVLLLQKHILSRTQFYWLVTLLRVSDSSS